LLTFGCFVVADLHPNLANAAVDLKSTIDRQYSAYDEDIERGKVVATFTRYDKSFTAIDAEGKFHSLADVEASAQLSGGSVVTSETHRISDFQLAANAREATVVVDIQYAVRSGDIVDQICRDFWINTKAGWVLKRERIVSMTRTQGGKAKADADKSSKVTPDAPINPTPLVAIHTGGDAAGNFSADAFYHGTSRVYGTLNTVDTSGVIDPAPQAIYQTSRLGNFVYTIPNLSPNKTYLVRLHFSENAWTVPGQRIFNVSINKVHVLTNFDIVGAAGSADKAVIETFTTRTAGDGTIVVEYVGVVDVAASNGIEIFDAPSDLVGPYASHVESGFSKYEGAPFTTVLSQPPTIPVAVKKYILRPLPTPPGDQEHAGSINNYGMIVGWIQTSSQSFLWLDGRITMPIPHMDQPFAINDSGQVAGVGKIVDLEGNVVTHLGSLPGYTVLIAQGINNKKQVVGYALSPVAYDNQNDLTLPAVPFLWEHGHVTQLEVPVGYKAGRATHINNHGEVSGWLLTNNNQTHAAVWKDGKADDIGTFAGGTVSKAFCINDNGQVVGSAQHNDGTVTAFLWQNGVMYNLGKFEDDEKSRAYYINNFGQVVGASFSGDINNFEDSKAFLWDSAHGMRDLTSLMAADDDMRDQMEGSTSAYAINDRGQIIGVFRPQDKSRNMFLLTPGP